MNCCDYFLSLLVEWLDLWIVFCDKVHAGPAMQFVPAPVYDIGVAKELNVAPKRIEIVELGVVLFDRVRYDF